jgi:hypothetical protein
VRYLWDEDNKYGEEIIRIISAREPEERDIRRYQAETLDEKLNSPLSAVLPHDKPRATIRVSTSRTFHA